MRISGYDSSSISTLFSSLNGNSSSSLSGIYNNLSDSKNIISGNYYKLTKAYFNKISSSSSSNSTSTTKKSTDSTDTATEARIAGADADALTDSVTKLMSKSTYASSDEDDDTVSSAVKGYVDNYNAMIKAGTDSSISGIARQTDRLASATSGYKSELSDIGVTINSDNTLSVDEDKLNTADKNKVKSLFTGSYGMSAASVSSMIGYYADSASATGYTSTGSYSTSSEMSSLYNYFS